MECNQSKSKDESSDVYNDIVSIKVDVGGYFSGNYEVELDFISRRLSWRFFYVTSDKRFEKTIRQKTLNDFIDTIKNLKLMDWDSEYLDLDICDGTQWGIEISKKDDKIMIRGDNKFPDEWDEFCQLISRTTGKRFG
ncbi:MAG: hypothetical protein K8R73_00575 [Clostridiales bacterium]|nr:hypothetical protein [Clostridiales bacterium]